MVSPSAPISCNAMPRGDSKTEMTNRRWMQRLRGKWLLMLAALPSCVLAGPPFRTDDPAVVEYKHFELIAFYQQSLAGGGRSGVMPGFEFHYGAFDKVERVEDDGLQIGPQDPIPLLGATGGRGSEK